MRDVIERRLAEQFASIDTFTTRAGLVLATCGVAFAGYAQLLTSEFWLDNCAAILFVLEIGLVCLAGFFAFSALVPGGEERPWSYDPDPEKLYRLGFEEPHTEVEDQAVRAMIDAYGKNKEIFRDKFTQITRARMALYGSGAVFLIHLVVVFF